ncbi:helix-turn-helix domain-containing protein [Microbacterium sp.]|uniref:helix-turn-helix domain-containing protein n=1 Tax=Microbacterium sp. TaxID=51671 RepID=UPI003A8DE8C0
MTDYGEFLRARRGILGLSQRELAERSGVKQPYIAAIERGRREASDAARRALDAAVQIRPSVALAARKGAVLELFLHREVGAPRVFGSVARGDDTTASDIDLLAEFTDAHDIVDLLELEDDLARVLTFRADVVDSRSDTAVTARARAEAVPL